MAYLPSLPDHAVLPDVLRAYPDTARPLLDYHQALLRGPSPLGVAERELIAAYVSGLNADGLGITAGQDYFRTAAPLTRPAFREHDHFTGGLAGCQEAAEPGQVVATRAVGRLQGDAGLAA